MAVSTATVFSFASVGVPASVSGFDPHESTTNPKRPVGFKVEDLNGNVYRWAHFGATTYINQVVGQDISESSKVDSDNIIVAPASAATTTDGTVGSRFIEITLASVTQDQYAGGTFIITGGTVQGLGGNGYGGTYRIIGNTATGDPASGNFRLELDRPLMGTLDATTDFTIVGSQYANLEPATSNTDYIPAGIALAEQAAGDYGWIQTKGIAGIYCGAATTGGVDFTLSTTAGAIIDFHTGAPLPIMGVTLMDGDASGTTACLLMIE